MRGRHHLMVAVPIYILAVRYLSHAEKVLLSPLLFAFCLLTMAGSLFPDIDWMVMRVYGGFGHRNPITHSMLIPGLILLALSTYHIDYPLVMFSYQAFTLGVGSHLFGDIIKTGNIVWIPREHEDEWYIINGAAVFLLLHYSGFFKPPV